MNQINFLENVWEKIRAGKIQNAPIPYALNFGLAYTYKLPDSDTNLLWLPYEYTGLAYIERIKGSVDVVPYYRGHIVEEFEISHGMDLHKPKTEEAVLKHVYKNSWELHNVLIQEKYNGTAIDYLYKLHQICDVLSYFNSAVPIPVK